MNLGSEAWDLVWVKFLANENRVTYSTLVDESVQEESVKLREFVPSVFEICLINMVASFPSTSVVLITSALQELQ